MDLAYGLIADQFLLNDWKGSLYAYEGDLIEIYSSRSTMKIWTPYKRRAIGFIDDKIVYSDSRDTFVYEDGELVPIDLPPGNIIDNNLICQDKKFFRCSLSGCREYEVPGTITACYGSDEPVIAYFDGDAHVYDSTLTITNDLISVIEWPWIGTIKGILVNLKTREAMDLGREIRDIKVIGNNLLVLVRVSHRTLLFVIEDGDIARKELIPGRYNTIVINDELFIVGEDVRKLEPL